MTHDHSGVLVGVGDASDGGPELDWAAREAVSRHRRLYVVHAVDESGLALPWEDSSGRPANADAQHRAELRLAHTRTYLANTWPDLEVEARVIEGPARQVLTDASAEAALTVLGSRGRGGFSATLMGSVSTAVAAQAHGPVVIVRDPSGDRAARSEVVVGVDGSPAMHEVLAFAFDHASRHRHPLRVMFSYGYDLLATSPWRSAQPGPERAERWLAEVTAGWQEKYPDVEVRRVVADEHPVSALVDAARGQDLVVVGSRSTHTRLAALLGSVSQGVLHHAASPVAVVPLGASD